MHSIGKYSYGTPTILWNVDNSKVVCGNFVCISDNVTIFLGNGRGHDSSFVTIYPFGYINFDIFDNVVNNSKNTNGDVHIGNDVWIGYGSTIMSGVTIADGAVIAANSHVIKNVEPYSIVGGNPAKHIKYRFCSNQIEKLLQIKWWNWSDYRINAYMSLILSNNIDKFIITALTDDTDYTKPNRDNKFIRDEVEEILQDIISCVEIQFNVSNLKKNNIQIGMFEVEGNRRSSYPCDPSVYILDFL